MKIGAAARSDEILIAPSALGSGLIEDPALTGLLGTLAPALLGEELALRGPETWWCGHEAGLRHVLAHLSHLMILPVHPSVTDRPVPCSQPRTATSVRPSGWRR